MFRLLIAALLIGSCCHVIADDDASPRAVVPRRVPPSVAPHVVTDGKALPPNAVRYVAKIKLLEVSHKQTTRMQTEVAGVVGTPLKTDLSGPCMGRQLKFQVQDVPGDKPTKYVAEFQWLETEKDGTARVLFTSSVMTTAGVPAMIRIGEDKGDRFQLDLSVTEGSPATKSPKPATPTSTSSIQPAPPASSSLGTSLMRMVNPRIIIQEEEEERLSVPQW